MGFEKAIFTAEIDEIDHLSEVEELSEQLHVKGSRAHVLLLHLETVHATRELGEELYHGEALCHSQDI